MRSGRTLSGEKLRKLREAKLMSPPEVASKAGLHPTTVLDVENGRRTTVHYGTIRKLAVAFEMTSEDFIAAVGVEIKAGV